MARDSEFGRALLVACDVAAYGTGDDQLQATMQEGLIQVLDEAATEARLVRSEWKRDGSGDGELALLPATESEPRVVDDFIRELCAALSRHNRHLLRHAHLRLRVAIHFGVAYPASNGYAGQGVVAVSRLLDSGPLRLALQVSEADLALILSDRVYQDTVMQGHTSLRAADFRQVAVQLKEFCSDAWIWLPGNAVHDLQLSEGAAGRAKSGVPSDADGQPKSRKAGQRGAPEPSMTNIFQSPVHAPNSIFGIQINNEAETS